MALISKITLGFLLQMTTDDGIRELSERCQQLRYVCLSKCTNLTDLTLISLAQCPLLNVLECDACNFTDMGFEALARVSWSAIMFES